MEELIEYMTVAQYADKMKVSVQAIYASIEKGRVKAKKVGKTVLIPVVQ